MATMQDVATITLATCLSLYVSAHVRLLEL